jgi:hypothetical protein
MAPTAAINRATPATISATQLKVLLIRTSPFYAVRASTLGTFSYFRGCYVGPTGEH